MALITLGNQNIKDTFQKIVQTDGTNLADGTGSLLPISFNGNNVVISGSLIANKYIVSSSVTNITMATLSGSTNFGNSSDDTHTFTGHITASGKLKLISTAQDAISTNGNIIGGTKISSRTGSFNLLTLTQGAAQDSGEEGDANLTFIGLQNILRAFSNTENSAVERGYNSNVGFIENFASTVGSFGTGTTVINNNISSSGFALANNITASGNISASGNLTVSNINGTINGGNF
tara:strand:+ start:392 stop:1093 length:702 start_codon:yes stop_codon:yes gene_type:complete